ncbi:MAG: PPOX class F420-dependent oxidoreductase [Roseiflexaceae bacterium]
MQEMSPEQYRAFLLERPRTAKLATVRADGRPHVAPIWFDLDGDALVFTTWHTTVKAANLRRDPRVSLCIDDDTPPYAFVLFEGSATISEDAAELRRWATSIAGRYMGSDQAAAYGSRNGVPGELLVRVTPAHVVAKAKISD